jgi:hypothetical protein
MFFVDLICLPTVWRSSLALVEMLTGIHIAKPLNTTKDYHKDAFPTLEKDLSSWSTKNVLDTTHKRNKMISVMGQKRIDLSCWSIVKRRKDSREVIRCPAIVKMAWITNYNQTDFRTQKIGTLCRCRAHQMYISRSIG